MLWQKVLFPALLCQATEVRNESLQITRSISPANDGSG